MAKRKCFHCGKEFHFYPNRGRRKVWCSLRCFQEYYKTLDEEKDKKDEESSPE